VSDDQPSAWGGAPAPPRLQPAADRPCLQCGRPIPAVEPVCRHCGHDHRLRARPPVPGYAQPPVPGYAPPATSGLAIASLVLGILWLYWVGSVLALVFGYMARQQIDRAQGAQGGRGLATAGIVLGWIGIGFLALFMVILMIGLASSPA
jgi:hypothetical protein